MTKFRNTTAHKPYGNGFDMLANKAVYADFLTWWNDRSLFPVNEATPAAEMKLAA